MAVLTEDPLLQQPLPGGESAPAAVSPPAPNALGPMVGNAAASSILGYTPAKPVSFDAGATSIPGWNNAIAAQPDYMQWRLSAAERADTGAANRKAAMRALALRFGGLPPGFQDVYGDLNQETLDTAAANPVSEQARLLKQYTDQVEQNRRQLASRGVLQSGELGYSQDQLGFQRAGDVYDMNNAFLDQSQGTVNDYASLVAQLKAEQIDQIRAAAAGVYGAGYRDPYASDFSGYGGSGGGGGAGPTTPPDQPTVPFDMFDWNPAFAGKVRGETGRV